MVGGEEGGGALGNRWLLGEADQISYYIFPTRKGFRFGFGFCSCCHGFYLCYLLKKCVLMVLLIDRQTRHRGVEMLDVRCMQGRIWTDLCVRMTSLKNEDEAIFAKTVF